MNTAIARIVIFALIFSVLPGTWQIAVVILGAGLWLYLLRSGRHTATLKTILGLSSSDEESDVSGASTPASNKGNHEGVIVKMGAAPFEHDKRNRGSFYITLRNSAGTERTLWGVDLGRVVRETSLKAGDHVSLAFLGKQNVVVNQPIRDDQGKVVGSRKIETHRNTWSASVLS